MARSIPLGAQAHVAVETVDVLRKYGLKGIYGLILRKEFLAAADLLCRACDINQDTFPLSVHELSAAIFYALAQHRAKRGMDPEREYLIHAQRQALGQYNQLTKQTLPQGSTGFEMETLLDEFDQYDVTSQQCIADFAVEVSSMIPNEIQAVRNQNDKYFPVCDVVSDEVLNECIQYAPIALNFIYVERNVDMQLLAAQQGWRLLYSHLEQEPGNDLPGSALFVHEEKSVVCFAVRGTATINDVVTDLRQVPVPFPESETEKDDEGDDWTAVFKGHGLAVCGMARAANNLFREHIGVLELFALRSYKIRIVGHSLGAAVATLLGALVKRHLESIGILSGEDFTKIENSFHVYGFASPSCVDATLSDYMQSFVTSVVLHDDVVPRLTPTSIRGLMKHLLHIRETWVQKHLKDDLDALKERAKSAWAPRWRSGFTLKDASGFCRKHLQYRKEKNRSEKKKKTQTPSFQDSVDRTATTKSRCDDVVVDGTSSSSDRRSNHEDYVTSCTPKLLVEFMGGINNRTSGMILDGDAFFDTQASLLEEESDNSSCDQFVEYFATAEQELVQQRVAEEQVEKQSNQANVPLESFSTSLSPVSDGDDLDDHSAPVMLDETPLPRMFLPGKIIHIYTHRGVYKAAFVPRTFRELRHISMAGNMLSDHTSKAYFEALKEVRSVRAAQYDLPKWTAFDEDDTCSCCASRFTWASTSDSEAQEARDKHNCRSCGTLCCDPCSRNQVPLPRIGLMIPVRVCDRCYHDMGGSMLMENSIDSCDLESLADSKAVKHDTSIVDHQKNRRSAVVDELASSIHSSVTVFN
jgi:Lipase (class 3)/FYVE zinc finger